jgi:uncharacterized membrane protein
MDATITIKDALLFLIMGSAVVLILYVIFLVKNLIATVKHTNTIMADAEVITKIAKERAEDVDKMMDGLADSVTGITSALKGKESVIRSLSSIASAITSIVNMLKKK